MPMRLLPRQVNRIHRRAGRKLSWHLAACPRAKQLWRTHASSGSRLLTKLQPGGRSGRSSTGIAFAPSNHTLQHGFVMSGPCCKQSQMRDGHMHAMHDGYSAVSPSIRPWQGLYKINTDRRCRSTDITCTYNCQNCRSSISNRLYCYSIRPKRSA